MTATRPWAQDALLLFAISLVGLTWFGSHQFLWTPDSNFPTNLQPSVQRYFEVWDFRSMPGLTDSRKMAFVIPWGVILGAWSSLSLPFSPALYERGVVVALLWSSMLSAYILFQVVGSQLRLATWAMRFGGLLSGLLYGFNFFGMLTIWSALAFLMYGYAFLPLILALVLRGLERGASTRYAIGVAIAWTLLLSPAYVTTPVAVTDWACVMLVAAVSLVTARFAGKVYVNRLAFVGKVLVAWVAFNLLWLAAFITLETGEVSKYAGSQSLFSWNAAALADSFRLAGYPGLTATYKGFPYFAWANWYSSPWIVLSGFLPPVLALVGLTKRRSPALFALATVWLVALFLVKGPAAPFGGLTDSLLGGGLLGTAFRSTYQRFMGYAALGVAILAPIGALETSSYLGSAFHLVSKRSRGLRWSDRTRTAAVCLVVAALALVYVAPEWSGSTYQNVGLTPSYRVSLPSYWTDLASWLDSQPGDFAVMPFPYPSTTATTNLAINNGSDGLLGLYPLITLSHVPIAMGTGPGTDLATLLSTGTLRDARALNVLNVRYVLVHMDANLAYIQNNNQWVMAPPSQLMSSLNATSGLVFDRFFGEIAVFDNLRWQGSELLLFPSASDAERNYAAFVWNGVSGHVFRWEAVLNATEHPLVNEVFGIPLEPVASFNATLSYFAVTRYDAPSPGEAALPFWVEKDPSGRPMELWMRMGLVTNETLVFLYASDKPLLEPQPSQVFTDFFESFELGTFAAWNGLTGNWTTTTALAIDGTSSAVAGPGPSTLDRDWNVTSGVLEGWFRFDTNSTAHLPFVIRGPNGLLGYWAVILPGGTWGYFDGVAYVAFPVRHSYAAGSWTEVRLAFDFEVDRFWVYVDGLALTPVGLPCGIAVGQVRAGILGFRIQNVGDNATGRMWADALRARPYVPYIGDLPSTNMTELDLAPVALPYQFVSGSHTDIQFSINSAPGEAVVWLKGYSAGWTLAIDGITVADADHFTALGYWNGWTLSKAGNLMVTIYYAPQRLLTVVFVVSSLALAAAMVYVLLLPVLATAWRSPKGRDLN